MNRYLTKISTFTETDDIHRESLVDTNFDDMGRFFGDGRLRPTKRPEFTIDPLVKKAFEFKAHSPLISAYGVAKWSNARIEERPNLRLKKDILLTKLRDRLKYTDW